MIIYLKNAKSQSVNYSLSVGRCKMMSYSGKNIIITGGTGGICFELAREFLREGALSVGLLDIADPNNVTAALQNEFTDKSIVYYAVDVRRPDDLRSAFAQFTKQFEYVDIVIVGAGILNENNPADTIAVNLVSVIEHRADKNNINGY